MGRAGKDREVGCGGTSIEKTGEHGASDEGVRKQRGSRLPSRARSSGNDAGGRVRKPHRRARGQEENRLLGNTTTGCGRSQDTGGKG